MYISVIPYAAAIRSDLVENKPVVVIDVLRASSVMVTALNNGAKAFLPVMTVEEARNKAKVFHPDEVLLCGERDTRKIEDFHLGNSPEDYSPERVSGKTLILTTSNGTQALNNLREASHIFIGSFLNMNALVKRLVSFDEVVLVCSGTNQNYSMDDGMCAAFFIEEMKRKKTVFLSDMGITLLKAYQKENGDLNLLLSDCYHLNLLKRNGFTKDVTYCLQKNKIDIVPVMRNGKIVID